MAEPSASWMDYVQQLSIPRMLRPWAEKSYGMLGLMADTASEGLKLALFSNWLLEPTSPDDILPKIAKERRLPRYPAEAPAQHRTRLHGAWNTWRDAGSDHNLVTQFAFAGWPGVLIFDNVDIYQWETPHDTSNVSRFWVVLPPGSHSFESDGNWDDPGTWNDGGLWNSNSATIEQIQTMRGIIRKFKPVDWKCQAIIAVVSWDNPTLSDKTNFAAGTWTKGANTSIAADAIAGPFPSTFGDTVTNSSGSSLSTIYVSQSPGNVEAGRPTHFTADAKAGSQSWIVYSDGAGALAWFDVTNGRLGSVSGDILQREIVDLGNGWWRCRAVTDADPALARWHVAGADGATACPGGGTAYLYQADVYNNKFDEFAVIG